jgi:hypothetical protein
MFNNIFKNKDKLILYLIIVLLNINQLIFSISKKYFSPLFPYILSVILLFLIPLKTSFRKKMEWFLKGSSSYKTIQKIFIIYFSCIFVSLIEKINLTHQLLSILFNFLNQKKYQTLILFLILFSPIFLKKVIRSKLIVIILLLPFIKRISGIYNFNQKLFASIIVSILLFSDYFFSVFNNKIFFLDRRYLLYNIILIVLTIIILFFEVFLIQKNKLVRQDVLINLNKNFIDFSIILTPYLIFLLGCLYWKDQILISIFISIFYSILIGLILKKLNIFNIHHLFLEGFTNNKGIQSIIILIPVISGLRRIIKNIELKSLSSKNFEEKRKKRYFFKHKKFLFEFLIKQSFYSFKKDFLISFFLKNKKNSKKNLLLQKKYFKLNNFYNGIIYFIPYYFNIILIKEILKTIDVKISILFFFHQIGLLILSMFF